MVGFLPGFNVLVVLTGLNALTYVMDNLHHGKEVQQKVLDLVDQGPQKRSDDISFLLQCPIHYSRFVVFHSFSLFFQFVQMGRTGDIIRARTLICLPADVWCTPNSFYSE